MGAREHAKIHLLRHGQTRWNLERRLQGQQNVSLDETGKQQIERFCAQTQYPYTLIVTSPLLRAIQSAEICSRRFGIPLTVDPAFAERSFGVLEGMHKNAILQRFHIKDVEALDNGFGVEPIHEFCGRLAAGLRQLSQSHRDDCVLLVTHGSVIRLLMMMTSAALSGVAEGMTSPKELQQVSPKQIVPNGHLVKMDLSQEVAEEYENRKSPGAPVDGTHERRMLR